MFCVMFVCSLWSTTRGHADSQRVIDAVNDESILENVFQQTNYCGFELFRLTSTTIVKTKDEDIFVYSWFHLCLKQSHSL